VVLETISMDTLDHFVILVFGDDQLGLLWLWLSQVLLLGNLSQVVFSLVVGSFHLLTLKITLKGLFELLKELKLHLFFNLRDDLPAENEEVVSSILTNSGLVTDSQMWVDVRPNWSPDSVSNVS
jgi:hypothetical protein